MLSPIPIVILGLYPIASFAAPAGYFFLFPKEIHSLPALPLNATNQEGKAAVTRLGVNVPLTLYGMLLVGLILWLWLSQPSFLSQAFEFKGSASAALKGGYFGLSWAGIWLWLWLVFSNARRLRREVPGYGAPFAKQIAVSLFGAFSEELWRVLCITVLLAHGYSVGFSVAVTALAFGLAFLANGPERSALAALEGAIFGMLFVWQRSLFAPLSAHLAVQAVYLWGVGQFSLEGERKSWMRGIRCPVCKAQLNRFQIKMRDPFNCPSCHQQISVSDGYRRAMRWVGLSAYLILYASTAVLLERQMSDTLQIILVWPIAFGAGTSGFLLYQRVFPPQLQYGSPTFITLDLDHDRPNANHSENKRD